MCEFLLNEKIRIWGHFLKHFGLPKIHVFNNMQWNIGHDIFNDEWGIRSIAAQFSSSLFVKILGLSTITKINRH